MHKRVEAPHRSLMIFSVNNAAPAGIMDYIECHLNQPLLVVGAYTYKFVPTNKDDSPEQQLIISDGTFVTVLDVDTISGPAFDEFVRATPNLA